MLSASPNPPKIRLGARVGARAGAHIGDLDVSRLASSWRFLLSSNRSPLAIIEADDQGRISFWNPKAQAIFGYSPEEVMGWHFEFLFPFDDPLQIRKIWNSILKQEDGFTWLTKSPTRDGRIVYCKWYNSPILDENGRSIGVVSMVEDVTAARAAKKSIVESENGFRAIAEALPVGVVVSNLGSGQVLFANRSFYQMLRVPREKRVGYKIQNVYSRKSVRSELQDGLKSGDLVQGEWTLRRYDGTSMPGFVSVQKLIYQGVEATITGIVDFTEKNRAEKLLAEQQAKLIYSAKMSELGQMAGGMAHEINNPLAVIHGHARLLKTHAGMTEIDRGRVQSIAEKIETTALRIAKIVRGLKAFARDGETDEFETVPVQSVIEDTLEFCHERFNNHHVKFAVITSPEAEGLRVRCRPVQLSQVLLNLLNNAFDAVVELGTNEEKEVRLEIAVQDGRARISVIDNGRGVPQELREKIMQPFFTTKRLGQGTGLGLSIAQGIVADHGGTLSFESEARNTRFEIALPAN